MLAGTRMKQRYHAGPAGVGDCSSGLGTTAGFHSAADAAADTPTVRPRASRDARSAIAVLMHAVVSGRPAPLHPSGAHTAAELAGGQRVIVVDPWTVNEVTPWMQQWLAV